MSNITSLFEEEILNKIQAKNELDKKLETSRLGFNRGISYLEDLCDQLQKHIPSLTCELKMDIGVSKSKGHFIFIANRCKIVVQVWGIYNEDGGERMGFTNYNQHFTLLYRNTYFGDGGAFEKLLVSEIVSKFDVVQIS